LARRQSTNTGNLSADKRFEILERFRPAGSDPTGSSLDHVKHREGFERGGNQEFIQFLYVAKGSCGEVRSQLYVALDQGYVGQKVAESLFAVLKRLSVMIKHLIDHLKRSGMRGPKYDPTRSSYSETS
jgi:hypothetical protein